MRPDVIFIQESLSLVWSTLFTKLGRRMIMQLGVILVNAFMLVQTPSVFMWILTVFALISMIWTNLSNESQLPKYTKISINSEERQKSDHLINAML
jgi:hypothetical protein